MLVALGYGSVLLLVDLCGNNTRHLAVLIFKSGIKCRTNLPGRSPSNGQSRESCSKSCPRKQTLSELRMMSSF